MDPRKLFFDDRFSGFCVFCGAVAGTRDHVPSKVLLDEPYPANLPIVAACETCNNAFSKDEPYLACLLECAIHGSASAAGVGREKVKRLLSEKPHFAIEMEASRSVDGEGNLSWAPNYDRVSAVVLKLARGHAAYEFSEPCLDEPESVVIVPIATLTEEQRRLFEQGDVHQEMQGWPEVGSRAFCRLFVSDSEIFSEGGWNEVQLGRYRYLALPGLAIRIVLSEYLACEVTW